ncbi:MAG: DUF1385 domain-containing protein [Anaerolineae bacterium]|nr:DUF1385 domain-containing protein [Anaerolineae bacterium]
MTENSQGRKTLGWSYGGQAVMEGVMMRGRYQVAIAVRRPNDHEIVVKQEPTGKLYRGSFSRIPFLRGVPMLWDSLGLGMKALFFSAEVVGQAEDPEFKMNTGSELFLGAFSLLAGMALFMVLPSYVAGVLITKHDLLFNIIEGLIRLVLLIGYMAVIGRMEEIRRVFAYHGAEHKTINAHEDGAPLTVEGVRPYSRQHARCGTAFLLVVVLISILVFAPLGKPPLPIRIISRLLLLPVIAGIAYEVLRFTGKHAGNPIIRALIAPNLALQNLTTREPDDSMLEVAITALKTVLAGESEGEQPQISPPAADKRQES